MQSGSFPRAVLIGFHENKRGEELGTCDLAFQRLHFAVAGCGLRGAAAGSYPRAPPESQLEIPMT